MKHLSVELAMSGSYLCVDVKPACRFYLEVPEPARPVQAVLASVLGFGCAASIRARAVSVQVPFNVPKEILSLATVFSHLTKRQIHLRSSGLSDDGAPQRAPLHRQVQRRAPRVLLFSGGKDSLAEALRLRQELQPALLLYVRGPTLNPEFPREVLNVHRLSTTLKVPLRVVDVYSSPLGGMTLRPEWRTAWREMFLFTVASLFSSEIRTGISSDPYYSQRQERILRKQQSRWASYLARFFASTDLSIGAFERMLSVRIHKTGPELENLALAKRWKGLYERGASCYTTPTVCTGAFAESCDKCKSILIYDRVLNGEPLTEVHVQHVLSRHWIGDDDLRTYLLRLRVRERLECEVRKEDLASWRSMAESRAHVEFVGGLRGTEGQLRTG
jgi:hypothetical protein